MEVAGCMYLDEQDYVQWTGLGIYSKPADYLAFVKDFPKADLTIVKAATNAHVNAAVATLQGKRGPRPEHELGEKRRELGEWSEIAKELGIKLADVVQDLIDGKAEIATVDPEVWKQQREEAAAAAAAARAEEAANTKGALNSAEFVELLKKKIDPKDRVVRIEGDGTGSMRSGQVFVNFYNLPKSEAGASRGEQPPHVRDRRVRSAEPRRESGQGQDRAADQQSGVRSYT